ncbi:unnamed protein product [Rotaria sp. Silwood1]|nr:unnamed protein product [Rotaria sp. Silwood1]
MKEVVDFADAKDSSGKRRRSWKTVKHRYRSLPDQNYISRFHQVGIEKELHSTRTLSFQGEKKTLGRVSSKNATTHSYTIQPTISLDGRVIGPMFLCLQETNGRMGDIVKRHLFEPKNVVITCSSSGKLTNSLVRYWRDKVLVPSIGKKTLLLSDSWTGQNDNSIYQDLKSVGKAVHRIQIPPKTTSDIQPLDKYFNRQIKNLAKKLYNRVALDQLDINLHERNNIIKLVSLIHNQISAPIF